ncbi:hypothetical protein B296_00026294, partial [Ensete ventricosum]
ATHERRSLAGDDEVLLLFLLFFSLFLLQSTLKVDFSVNRPPTAEIDRRRSILVVPPDSGGAPPTAEIDRRRSILVVPPDSGGSAYRSAARPVCTERYGALPLGRENLG